MFEQFQEILEVLFQRPKNICPLIEAASVSLAHLYFELQVKASCGSGNHNTSKHQNNRFLDVTRIGYFLMFSQHFAEVFFIVYLPYSFSLLINWIVFFSLILCLPVTFIYAIQTIISCASFYDDEMCLSRKNIKNSGHTTR